MPPKDKSTVYLSFDLKSSIFSQKGTWGFAGKKTSSGKSLKYNISSKDISKNLIKLLGPDDLPDSLAFAISYLKIMKYKYVAKEKMKTEINDEFNEIQDSLNSNENLSKEKKTKELKKLKTAKEQFFKYLDSR